MLTVIRQAGANTEHTQDAGVLPALIADKTRTFWLDMQSPTPEELQLLSSVFHFHPLSVEDASKPHQRPKLDEFDGYFFITADEVTYRTDAAQAFSRDKSSDEDTVKARQMSAFLGDNYIVTIHVEPVEAIRNLRDRCDHHAQILARGADYLLYSLLDTVVDSYFPIIDTLDEILDTMEDRIAERPHPDTLPTIFALKRDLTRIRKHAGPLREVVQSLTNRDMENINEKTLPYFRDVADHLFRIYETLDSYRDLMSNLLDAYLSQVSNEMNRVMQKLSIVATIFLPITFITGVFGMNFAKQPWINTDFWFWMFVMGVIAVGTFVWFKRRHWM